MKFFAFIFWLILVVGLIAMAIGGAAIVFLAHHPSALFVSIVLGVVIKICLARFNRGQRNDIDNTGR